MATQPCQIATESLEDFSDPFRGSRYRCLFRVTCGETGDTYVVEHIELKKRFAAKLLRAELLAVAHVVDRMRLEAESLGRLRHPNVVSITGFEHTPAGIPFMVMELLRGGTLEAELQARGVLPVDEAIHWTRQLLSALLAIHEIGIVHRDLTPHNLFLHMPKSGSRVLKVIDFGAARVFGASERSPRPLAFPTAEGAIVGSPEFASPEASSNQNLDPRSDLYQAGLILFTMLTGRTPPCDAVPGSNSGIGLIAAVPRPSAFRSDGLDPDLDSIVAKALCRNPEERFQTAAEFRLALDRLPYLVESSLVPGTHALALDQLSPSVEVSCNVPVSAATADHAPIPPGAVAPSGMSPLYRAWVFLILSMAIGVTVFAVGLMISRW